MGEPSNPFQATIGLHIDPAPINSGIEFRLEVELGSIPLPFHKAVEETTLQTLRQGLCGWQVSDCAVTMTHSGYSSPVSVAADFRNLTPLVVMDALKQAGTVVCEPIHRFHLDIPADTLAAVLPLLARLGAVPQISDMRGPSTLLEGDIPAARVHQLQQQLPALTRGEAVLEYVFDHYRPMRGTQPTRARSDHNPLNRKEYMLHLMRRRSNEVLTHDR
jgi:ribosomal protection tetracycline resistance protein